MTTLITGASGATGKQLVEQLLKMEQNVKVIVRPGSEIPIGWNSNEKVSVIKGNVTELSVDKMANYVRDCDAIACCLGHNMTIKGIFGKPHRLVTDTVRLICDAIKIHSPGKPVRFVLMNTAGNSNRDLNEPISFAQKFIIALLRLLLPPHRDNEEASDIFRKDIGQKDPDITWVVVRPDSLVDHNTVTEYETYPSPVKSALFNPGKTSRINVGNFMANLIVDDKLWDKWKGQMPVIYNKETKIN